MFPLQSPEREDFCSLGLGALGAWLGGEAELQAQPSIKLMNLRFSLSTPICRQRSSNLKQQCNLVTSALIKQLGEFLLS